MFVADTMENILVTLAVGLTASIPDNGSSLKVIPSVYTHNQDNQIPQKVSDDSVFYILKSPPLFPPLPPTTTTATTAAVKAACASTDAVIVQGQKSQQSAPVTALALVTTASVGVAVVCIVALIIACRRSYSQRPICNRNGRQQQEPCVSFSVQSGNCADGSHHDEQESHPFLETDEEEADS